MDRDSAALPNGLRISQATRVHHRVAWLLAAAAAGVANPVMALGVGRPLTQSSLGQPLNILFPLRLNPAETLAADCVRAEVVAGEARIPANLVQVLLEGENDPSVRAVRLQSAVQIDEPIVTVNLSLGCPARFTRQYTAFIDPSNLRGSAALPSVAEPASVEFATRNDSPALRAALTSVEARPAALPTAATAPLMPSAASFAPSLVTAAKPAAPARQSKQKLPTDRQASGLPRPAGKALSEASSKAPSKAPFKVPSAMLASSTRSPGMTAAAPQGRLRLDASEPAVVAAVAVDLAASQAELLATMAQLETLGQNLGSVQREQRATQSRLLAMRAELEAANHERAAADRGLRMLQAALILALVALVALAGTCVYLWRSRRQGRAQRWWNGSDQAAADLHELDNTPKNLPNLLNTPNTLDMPERAPIGPTPGLAPLSSGVTPTAIAARAILDSDEPTLSLPVLSAAPAFAMSVLELTEPASATTVVGVSNVVDTRLARSVEPVAFSFTDTPDRRVTVEALIDLEQQVEFFLVLGQVDAAIDLLRERIDSGAASALPYLKLLEIHQQQGLPGQAAFADLAEGFGARFGMLPPPWGADLNLGRPLDAYAAVLQSLQTRWSDSGASMALLQSLLSQGADDVRGFELPAYRDLLMLYSVARELSEREVRSEDIDLFLPFDDVSDESTAMMATMVWQVQPTLVNPGSVDLDLSLDEVPPRI